MKRLLFATAMAILLAGLCRPPATAQIEPAPSLRANQLGACKAPICVYRWVCRCDLSDRF